MKHSEVKIVFDDDSYMADYGRFDVEISYDELKAHCHFHHDSLAWQEFGQQLSRFPASSAATVIFDPEGAGIRLEAYCYNPQGHSALRVRVETRGDCDPDWHRLEFSIRAEVASLNKLGRLLAGWSVGDTPEIIWQAQTS